MACHAACARVRSHLLRRALAALSTWPWSVPSVPRRWLVHVSFSAMAGLRGRHPAPMATSAPGSPVHSAELSPMAPGGAGGLPARPQGRPRSGRTSSIPVSRAAWRPQCHQRDVSPPKVRRALISSPGIPGGQQSRPALADTPWPCPSARPLARRLARVLTRRQRELAESNRDCIVRHRALIPQMGTVEGHDLDAFVRRW